MMIDAFAIASIVTLAGLSQSFAGFGFMLVTLSLGAQFMAVPEVVAIGLPLSMVSAGYVAWTNRAQIRWRWLLSEIAPFMVTGTAIGFVSAAQINPHALKKVLGVTILMAVALSWLQGQSTDARTGTRDRLGAIVAGLAQGMFGVGGPVLVLLAQRARLSPGQFRATLTTVWSSINTVLVVVMALSGRYSRGAWALAVIALPCVWLGSRLGDLLHERVSPDNFRRLVMLGLTLSGLSLLIR